MNRIEEIVEEYRIKVGQGPQHDFIDLKDATQLLERAVREAADVPLRAAEIIGEHGTEELKIRVDAAKGIGAAILAHFGLKEPRK